MIRERGRAGRAPIALAAAALFAGAAAGAGCAADHVHVNLGTAIDRHEVESWPAGSLPRALEAAAPLPPIAVAISLAPAAPGADRPAAGDAAGEPLECPPRAVGDEIVALLAATRLFENVFAVGRDAAKPDLYLAKEEARSKGASFLVEATLAAPDLRRTENAFVLPTLVYLCTGIPNMWIHSHVYRLECDVRLRLHDLSTGEAFSSGPLPPAESEVELNFHERTSSAWIYLLAQVFPSPFCPVDEEKVARAAAPSALKRPVGQFLVRLGESLKGEASSFRIQKQEGGAAIRVQYPPDGKPVYLLEPERIVRYAVEIEAPADAKIREVRVDGELVFPARRQVGTAARRRLSIAKTASVAKRDSLSIETVDTRGRKSACLIEKIAPAPAAAPAPSAAKHGGGK